MSIFRSAALVMLALSVSACGNPVSTSNQVSRAPVDLLETQVVKEHPMDRVSIRIADLGDASSTAIVLNTVAGTAEANPILAAFGDSAPIIAIPLKYFAKKAIVNAGFTPARANLAVDTGGILGTCNNLMVLAGAPPAISITLGITCAMIYQSAATKSYQEKTGRTVDGSVLEEIIE